MMNLMNKYAVTLTLPWTATVEVEAPTETQALAAALRCVSETDNPLPWDKHAVQATGVRLIAKANPDAAMLEAMLNVLRNNGFEVEERWSHYNAYGGTGKLVGYEITGKTPETEMSMSHEIDCSEYAEGLTADNFFAEWKRDATSFDPAWEVADVIQDLETADAAKCLRDMLEDCDAYAYHLRAVTAKMQKAMLEFDKKDNA